MKRFIVIFLSCVSSLGAVPLETLPFTIAQKGLYRPQGRFFIGAGQIIPNNNFSVATATRTGQAFVGLTPEKVTLNGISDEDNPLHGVAIEHLAMLERRPAVIPESDRSRLFLIDDSQREVRVYRSDTLKNANGDDADSVLSLTTTAALTLTPFEGLAALAAIPNQSGGFDGNGSGIAFASFKQNTGWDIFDAQTGQSGPQGNKAQPFGIDTPEIFIGSPVASIANTVALHYDTDLGLLYIGVQAQAGDGGVRSVVVASTFEGKIVYRPIAKDGVFSDSSSIVGGVDGQVAIFNVRTMQTRTHLRYLIVVGGNGADPALKQTVHALPIVNNRDVAELGTLANIQALPINGFNPRPPHRFSSRILSAPAEQPDQVYKANDPPARVGGLGVLPGPINDLCVAGEAVFVSCGPDPALNQELLAPGLFYSQPVFDGVGRISGWTDWQRVAGAATTVLGFEYDPFVGTFWYLPVNDEGITDTVERTEWSAAGDQFSKRQFPQERGGVQGLFDFPYTTESFTSESAQRLAVQIATGLNKVVLWQSGKQTDLFGPFKDLDDLFTSTDGTLTGFDQASVLALSGGVLSQLGPITSAAVVSTDTTGWFVVGGSSGVAVLVDNQGNGWPVQPGLGSGFSGLTAEHSWKLIRSTNDVRKLVADKGQLYILAQRSLERVTLSPESIVSQTVPGVLLNAVEGKRFFSDLYISGPLAMLATSDGLIRSGNGVSIETVATGAHVGWTAVTLPEAAGSLTAPGPVTRFAPIRTSHSKDTLYVLNGYVGLCQTLVYRFSITVENDEVTDMTVRLFPDIIIRGKDTFFTNLGEYRNYFVTDGSLNATSRSSFSGRAPILELLEPTLRSGEGGARSRTPFLVAESSAQTIGLLIRSSASGTWMVPGDFGIREQK